MSATDITTKEIGETARETIDAPVYTGTRPALCVRLPSELPLEFSH